MKNILFYYAMAIFTIMMWSMNIIYSKYLAGILTPSETSFLRWALALIIMIPISFRYIRFNFKKLLKYTHIIILMALSGIGVQNFFIYEAGYTASAMNMSLISILGPIFLIFFSHQKINILQIIGLFLTIFGVLEIILRGDFTNIKHFPLVPGDLYMLGSAVLFAVYSLIQRKTPNDIPPTALLTCAIVLSALIFVPTSFPALIHVFERGLSPLVWIVLLTLGFINSALAYLSWDISIKKIGAVDAGTLYYTMPIFSITAAYFLLNEKIYESQFAGIIFIIVGILFVIFGKHKPTI